MKTVKAWAIVDETGNLVRYGGELAIAKTKPIYESDRRYKVIRVEIRAAKRRRKT